ncbi:hypothetical protein HC248_01389 [Polaromonas vacuolata]|uniref:Excisionase n=1 Tax=Polaromonas vacuolata TaxID=37448 RepID=A0A6H2H8I5_9BURK|nr:excisionase [Polaromonas vacuolata]QJC56103.1 hypothetical protein HC248_01389 [Polaromonas vacuolata]
MSTAPYVTVDLAASLTGYSEKAIRRKIQDGIWLEGREYRRGPDGRILISIKGYQSWVESTSGQTRSASRSRSMASSSIAL